MYDVIHKNVAEFEKFYTDLLRRVVVRSKRERN